VSTELQVKRQLAAQNALHGAFAEVWMEMGGLKHLKKWAKKNPDTFYRIMARMTPGLQPQQAINGDVHVHVHHELQPGALDGVIEHEGDSLGNSP